MKSLWVRFTDRAGWWLKLPRTYKAQVDEANRAKDALRRSEAFAAALAARVRELERALAEDQGEAPGLTAAEIERLAILVEEFGEAAQAAGKVLRHGWESRSPYGGPTNRVALERELGDIRAIVGLMLDSRDLRLSELQTWQRKKREGLGAWTHHQGEGVR